MSERKSNSETCDVPNCDYIRCGKRAVGQCDVDAGCGWAVCLEHLVIAGCNGFFPRFRKPQAKMISPDVAREMLRSLISQGE